MDGKYNNPLSDKLLKTLPDSVCQSQLSNFNDESVIEFLQKRLSRKTVQEIDHELNKVFPLSKAKQVFKKKIKKQGCSKNLLLSNTKKRKLGLFNISKQGLLYKDLLPLNVLWNEYILDMLQSVDVENLEEVSQRLFKADFHGANIEVVKSKCPNLVDTKGIVVFETRNVFKILSEDNITRCIPKNVCEFSLKIPNYKVTFLGVNLLIRPAERSIKKIRNIKNVEL